MGDFRTWPSAMLDIPRKRLVIAGGVVLITGLLLVGFASLAARHAGGRPTKPVTRASIIDRRGALLAGTGRVRALWFNPRLSGGTLNKPPRQIARDLTKIFPDLKVDALAAQLASGRPGYVRRSLSNDQADRVNALGEAALQTPLENRRIYPNGMRAAHVLGFVRDGAGRDGVEAAMDGRLGGIARPRDPLTLSIMLPMQVALEDELSRGMAASAAKGAAGVVLNVDNGEVLALASLPAFDPNAEGKSRLDHPANLVTNRTYEFGSVFIPITAATAIDAGLAADLHHSYPSARPLKVGTYVIRDGEIIAPSLTLAEALIYSSPVVAAQVADEVGAARMQQTLLKLGMNRRLRIELPASAHPIWPARWSRTTTLTAAYGHRLAVTPLHLALAYAAMVNGGIWRPATLMKVAPGSAPQGHRAFAASTSQRMRQLLRLAVVDGTGRKANAPGFRVGGKTGSAEKPGTKGNWTNSVVATFVAAFPMDRPRLIVLVMLDEPQRTRANSYQRAAAWTAAPVAGRIIERIAPMIGVSADPAPTPNLAELRRAR